MRSVLALFTFLTVAAAGVLVAGDHLHGRTGGDMHDAMVRVFERIGVSSDQRRELETAHRRHDEVVDRIQAAMDEAHERLAQAIHADVFDETAIRNAAADYAAPQADLFVAKAAMLQDARRILTPDQLEQLRDTHMMGGSRGPHGNHEGCAGSPHEGHGDLHGHGTDGKP